MPKMDGTGPRGQGAGTGRGLGPCGAGRGLGMGMGRWGCGAWGCGAGRRFFSPQNELSALETEEQMLAEELRVVREELSALKNQSK